MTTRFTPEIRAETVRKATEPGADIDALGAEMELNPMVIRRWITMAKNAAKQKQKPLMKVSAGALDAPEAEPPRKDGEVARLHAEVARLKKDKETLKATLAMLIKDSE